MITDRQARLAKVADKPYKLTDGGGLYLHVTPAGGKIWRCRYEIRGREKLLTIGHFPAVSLANARAARDAARDVRRTGHDPAEARKRATAEAAEVDANTFEVVARDWHTRQSPKWRDHHAGNVIRSLECDIFPILGAAPIRVITPRMILDALRAIEDRGAVETAHRIRQRMSAVFVYGIASGLCENDPAAIVTRALAPVIRGRQPALVDLAGVREVLTRAEAVPAYPATRLAMRLVALTSVRVGEIRGATPAEFEGLDTPAPIWRIPAERMKMKREHVVPLSRQAVETIKVALALIGPRGRVLFPTARHADKPMSANALGYLLNRAGYHGRHVPHGFRAAFSTIMNEANPADQAVIDLMLAHLPKNTVEAAYNRAVHMERRAELAQAWADLLMADMPPAEELTNGPRLSRAART